MEELLQLGQGFKGTEHLHDVIEHLRQEYCNLPICTAIASFLYARQQVPIIDKFLSQFFAKRFKVQDVDGQTGKVLKCLARSASRFTMGVVAVCALTYTQSLHSTQT